MPPLDYHYTVDLQSTYGQNDKEVTETKLNANADVSDANEQGVEDRHEDTEYDIHNSGVLWGMAPTVPVYGGLSVDVAAGRALIGYSIGYTAASVSVEASKSPGYIFFCQGGTWHVDDDNTAPAGKASFLFATYTSDGYDVLTVTIESVGVHYEKIEADVAGAIAAGIIKTGIIDRDCFIEDVQIVLGNTGTYASTTVDFHVGDAGATPQTVFTTQGNRPTIASLTDAYTTDVSGDPEANRLCTAGQVYIIEVDAIGTGAEDLGVLVRLRYKEDLS